MRSREGGVRSAGVIGWDDCVDGVVGCVGVVLSCEGVRPLVVVEAGRIVGVRMEGRGRNCA